MANPSFNSQFPTWIPGGGISTADATELNTLLSIMENKTDSNFPLLLMPVRLEARFMNSNQELWVRIYPDDIFVNSLEPDLTAQEQADGITFWTNWWNAFGDKDQELGAWRVLCGLYHPQRAAWIVKMLTPTNLNQQNNDVIHTLINDLNNLVIYVHELANTNFTGVTGIETHFAAISDKLLVMQRGVGSGIQTGSYQFNKMNAAISKVVSSVNKLGASVASSGLDSVKLIHQSLTGNLAGLTAQLKSNVTNKDAAPAAATNTEKSATPKTSSRKSKTVDLGAQVSASQNANLSGLTSSSSSSNTVEAVNQGPVFPTLLNTKPKSWNEPARCTLMPDRFVVIASNDTPLNGQNHIDVRYVKLGNTIPLNLQIGIDPNSGNDFKLDPQGNLTVDDNIKWMTDFDAAVTDGMAVKIPLVNQETAFDKLFVLGLHLEESNDTGYNLKSNLRNNTQGLLENLFTAHHYTNDGMSILPVGTATKNTDANDSPYVTGSENADQLYGIELNGPLFTAQTTTALKQNGQWICDALGIDYDIFQNISAADATQVGDAVAINTALWPGTVGNYIRDMWNTIISPDSTKRTRSFFNQFVLGRGTIPAIRVGAQPYGILPVSTISNWSANNNTLKSDWFSVLQNSLSGTSEGQALFASLGSGYVGINNDIPTINGFWNANANPVNNPVVAAGVLYNSQDPNVTVYVYPDPSSVVDPNTTTFSYANVNSQPLLTPADFPSVDDFNYIIRQLKKAGTTGEPAIAALDAFMQQLYDQRLAGFMNFIFTEAKGIADQNVIYVRNQTLYNGPAASAQPQADFLNMMGLNASTEEYYQRFFFTFQNYILSSQYNTLSGNPEYWDSLATAYAQNNPGTVVQYPLPSDFWGKLKGTNEFLQTSLFTDYLFLDSNNNYTGLSDFNFYNARILKTQTAIEHALLKKDEVITGDNGTPTLLSNTQYLSSQAGTDYIGYLLDKSKPLYMYSGNSYEDGDPQPYNNFLFLMMRQAYLMGYRDSVMDYLINRNIVSASSGDILGNPESYGVYQSGGEAPQIDYASWPITKWNVLFEPFGTFFADPPYGYSLDNILTFFYPQFLNQLNNSGYGSESDIWLNQFGDTQSGWADLDAPDDQTIFNILTQSTLFTTNPPPLNSAIGGVDSYGFGIRLGDFLRFYTSNSTPSIDPLVMPTSDELKGIREMEAAFTQLQGLPTDELQCLLTEHLDLCSYRPDAWITGLFNERLWQQRNPAGSNTVEKGIYAGACGWLLHVNSNQSTKKEVAPGIVADDLVANGNPVYGDPDNLGFIHTPSIRHALATAILRSGYISEKDSNSNTDKFAVNLSSERVRLAMELLDGIRDGQELGAILGYRFEKGLHEGYLSSNEMDKYIYPLRIKFPLATAADLGDSTQTTTTMANNVINGIDLLNTVRTSLQGVYTSGRLSDAMFNNTNLYPFGLTPITLTDPSTGSNAQYDLLPPTLSHELIYFINELDRLANAIDALGDLALAEGVFQLASGNFTRSASTIDVMADGKNPPIPQIIDTPRTGTSVYHRLSLQMAPVTVTQGSDPWSLSNTTPRSLLDPTLNSWYATLLPDPANVKCIIEYGVGLVSEGPHISIVEVSLKQLGLQPADLVNIIATNGDAGWNELSMWLAYYVRQNDNVAAGIPLKVQFTQRDSSWDINTFSFYEIVLLLQNISSLVNSSRSINEADFQMPNDTTASSGGGIDFQEMFNRVSAISTDFATLHTNLQAATFTTLTDDVKRNYLVQAALYGVANTIPPYTGADAGDPNATAGLNASGVIAFTEVDRRIAKLGNQLTALGANTTSSNAIKYDALSSLVEIIFGVKTKILPLVVLPAQSNVYISSQLTPGYQGQLFHLSQNPAASADKWMYEASKIREQVGIYADVQLLSPVSTVQANNFGVIQLPDNDIETIVGIQYPIQARWVGIDYDDTYVPNGDKHSFVIINPGNLSSVSNAYNAGIVIDEWNEFIPGTAETTGLTFNYNQPNSKPPQNLLLAVNPNVGNGKNYWLFEELVNTVVDTVDMARIRCIEPDHFNNPNNPTFYGHILPAVVAGVAYPIQDTSGLNVTDGYANQISSNSVSFDFNGDGSGTGGSGNTGTGGSGNNTGTGGTGRGGINFGNLTGFVGNNGTKLNGLLASNAGGTGTLVSGQTGTLDGLRNLVLTTGFGVSYGESGSNTSGASVNVNIKMN